jgi:hypothetical protein
VCILYHRSSLFLALSSALKIRERKHGTNEGKRKDGTKEKGEKYIISHYLLREGRKWGSEELIKLVLLLHRFLVLQIYYFIIIIIIIITFFIKNLLHEEYHLLGYDDV